MNYRNKLEHYLKNVIVRNGAYGIAEVAVPFVLMFFATPFLIGRMGAENYGLWNIALAFLGVVGVFDFGVSPAVIKYISEYYEQNNIADLSAAVSLSFTINTIMGAIFGVLLYFFSGSLAFLFRSDVVSSEQIELILKAASLGFFPMMLQNIGLSIPRGFQNYRTPAIMMVIQNTFTLLSAVLIVFLGGSALQVMISTVILSWLTAVISLYMGWVKLRSIGAKPSFSVNTSKKILRFIMFMGLTGVGIAIFTFLDRIVVGQILGLSAAAYYTIATGVANKFVAIANALTRSLMPAFSSWGIKNNAKHIRVKLFQAMAVISIIIFLPGMLFLYFSRPIIIFWLGDKTGGTVLPVLQILVFIYTTRVIAMPAFQALNGLNFPHITTFTSLTGGIGTIIMIYFIAPHYGLVGAAWANAVSWVAFYTVIYLVNRLNKQDS